MPLTVREKSKLQKIIVIAQQLLALSDSNAAKAAAKSSKIAVNKRKRRTGSELVAFRKMLKAERKRGVPVADLAKAHGISAAYIYQL
jgi:SRSO17 transposase